MIIIDLPIFLRKFQENINYVTYKVKSRSSLVYGPKEKKLYVPSSAHTNLFSRMAEELKRNPFISKKTDEICRAIIFSKQKQLSGYLGFLCCCNDH